MRVISLKNRIPVISLVLSLIFVVGLIYNGAAASGLGFYAYLTAEPKITGNIPIQTLDDIDGGLMLAYENTYEKSVKALNSFHGVMLKGVNFNYSHVMGHGIISGGFFTVEAAENKIKTAVLNEKAAFEMFGKSLRYQGYRKYPAGFSPDF